MFYSSLPSIELLCLRSFKDYFFDLDGTLLATGPSIIDAISQTLDLLRIQHQSIDLQVFVGPPLRPMVKKVFSLSDEESAHFVALFRDIYFRKGLYLQCAPYKDVPLVLKTLKTRGTSLFVATSKPQNITLKLLDYFHLLSFFQDVQGSDDGKKLVTKKQVIGELITRNMLQREDVLMIGDTSSDIVGAKQSGVRSCGVIYGYGSREELLNDGADFLISMPKDLLSN